jgi:hypothetical protein
MKIFKSFFKKVEKNLLYPNHPNDGSKIETEFKNNLKSITNEYGEDIIGLPHNYGTAKVTADLLKRIKDLEEKLNKF